MNIINFHKQEINLYAINATLSDCVKDEHDMYGALGMSDEARSLMDESNKFKVRTLRLKRITKSKNINNESYEIWTDCYYDNKLDTEHIFCEYYIKCHSVDYYIDNLLINYPKNDVDSDTLQEKNELKQFLLSYFNDFCKQYEHDINNLSKDEIRKMQFLRDGLGIKFESDPRWEHSCFKEIE